MAKISFNRIVKINNIPYRQISPTVWVNQTTGEQISNSALAFLSRTSTKKTVTKVANAIPDFETLPLLGPSGACCKGGTCIGFYTSSACSATGGVWAGGEVGCTACVYGAYCSGTTCAGLGYQFQKTTSTFIAGGTCAGCIFGICCASGGCLNFGLVTQQQCANVSGTFYAGINSCSLCTVGSCCSGGNCIQGVLPNSITYRGSCPSNIGQFFTGGTCADCSFGACCTGGTCQGIISRGQCKALNGSFYEGTTCSACDYGAFCHTSGGSAGCFALGFRGQSLTSEFISGATCNACNRGTCCTPFGSTFTRQINVSQASCVSGTFFRNIFAADTCATGSCCIPNGYTCTPNIFRYDCSGQFNAGATCSACETGACCFRPNQLGYPCQTLSRWDCEYRQGTFFGGQGCSACNSRACCKNGKCSDLFDGEICDGITYDGVRCVDSPCNIGSCCTGGTCISDISRIDCINISGMFTEAFDCSIACITGPACEVISATEYNCIPEATKAQYGNIELFPGRTCGACITGVCCTGGMQTITNLAKCEQMAGVFFAGATETACDTGVFCTGAGLAKTCVNTGFRGENLSGEFITGGNCDICVSGACCKGGTCIGGTFMNQATCVATGGYFFPNAGCTSCITGAFCKDLVMNIPCAGTGYFGQNIGVTFFAGKTCSTCDVGVCCTGPDGCHSRVRRQYCDSIGGNFVLAGDCSVCESGVYCTGFGLGVTCLGPGKAYEELSSIFIYGGTCSDCKTGVFCTGEGLYSTCLDYGYKAQNLSNVFIEGGTCSDCQFAACCTGGSCVGITSIKNCHALGGKTFAGQTCSACDIGIRCHGPTFGFASLYICPAGTTSFRGSDPTAIFIVGATSCTACDGGVFCTGSNQNKTCIGSGYRGLSLSDDFNTTTTANCNLCIYGACCTGGTCAGITSANYCTTVGGTFYAGSTCSACTDIIGACCTGGACAGLTSSTNCKSIGGLFLPGATCSNCDYGVFCQGITCARLGYRGENISSRFIAGATCSSCLMGVCCKNGSCIYGNVLEYDPRLESKKGCQQIEGATFIQYGLDWRGCDECKSGVFCTGSSRYGSTCGSIGIYAERKTSSFIVGGSCDACIPSICCKNGYCYDTTDYDVSIVLTNWGKTGPTGTYFPGDYDGDGVVGNLDLGLVLTRWYGNEETCRTVVGGRYYRGRTCGNCDSGSQCSACDTGVYCTGSGEEWSCLGIGSAYANQGGVFIEGAVSCDACNYGAFCTGPTGAGQTCAGVTLQGFALSDRFEENADCSSCIRGVCCKLGEDSFIGTAIKCTGENMVFNPGTEDLNICNSLDALTDPLGICCKYGNCRQDVSQNECDGEFTERSIGISFGMSCETNACELGVCCKENGVISVTGGQCLGEMTRLSCLVTGGDFFSYAQGATCSNCIYIPMLASAVFKQIRNDSSSGIPSSELFTKQSTGETGNQIQPRTESMFKAKNNWIDNGDTWLSKNHNMYGQSATILHSLRRLGNGNYLEFPNQFMNGFKPWWTPGSTGITMSVGWTGTALGITYGVHDEPPPFSLGYVSSFSGKSLGYILNADGTTGNYGVARYVKLILGYDNPSDPWHNIELVYRYAGNVTNGPRFTLADAKRHARLDRYPAINEFPSPTPFITAPQGQTFDPYSSPILLSVFAENPLKYRVRPVGSCCVGATCIGIVTQDHCVFAGGTFNEGGQCSECYPNLVFGNCCVGGTHAGFMSLAQCNGLTGTFFKGTTTEAEKCIYGTICKRERVCLDQNKPQSYYGVFSPVGGDFFVPNQDLGCAACNYGLCCSGSTCYGLQPKAVCDSYNGTLYYDEPACTNNCDMGVCCKMDKSCGVYTNRANCTKGDEAFIEGYGAGQVCAACESMMVLKEYVSGVTYSYVFNKSTTYGTFFDGSYWVQEAPNLKLLKTNLTYMNQERTRIFNYSANTKVSNLQLHPDGFIGSVYIHGMVKNPNPKLYKNIYGEFTRENQSFHSIVYGSFDKGWIHQQRSDATENPNNYDEFDLLRFLDVKNQIKTGGITLNGNDVVICSATNFDPNNMVFPDNAGGYPYQVRRNRGNVLTYGIINCLSAEDAALAGATVCFRPPVCWPENDKANKPIYPVSLLEGKIPGQTGVTLINLSATNPADKILVITPNVMQKYCHASEFGGGIDYQNISPIWSMGGAYNTTQHVYGEQWIGTVNTLLMGIWGTSTRADQNVPLSTRRTALQKIVQFGIDAWGPILMWTKLGSGAGQRPARSRPWAMIAGYYLGITAMRNPESAQMLTNPAAVQTFFYNEDEGLSGENDYLVNTAANVCVTRDRWLKLRFGETGPENNYRGYRQIIARATAHERTTMIEVSNDPLNYMRYYQYLGRGYSFTISKTGIISYNGVTGITFSETGPRGLSYSNLTGYTFATIGSGDKIKIYGNFAKIHFGNVSSTTFDNPFMPYFDSGKQIGSSVQLHKVKIVAGSGAGPTEYKILHEIGNAREAVPASAAQGGGWQFILDRPWQHGVPNINSIMKWYSFGEFDAGVTRPCSFDSTGITTGMVFFNIENNPLKCPAQSRSVIWDGSPSPQTAYFGTSLDPWFPPYMFLDYLRRVYGATMSIDAVPTADYINQYIYTSPYNLNSLYPWYSGYNPSTMHEVFAGANLNTKSVLKSRINFARDFPGILRYAGMSV